MCTWHTCMQMLLVCVNVSMHEYICSHTHTHTHVPHIDFHCNTGGVAPTLLTQHAGERGYKYKVVFTVNRGWGIYNNQRSNTSKGWGFPKKVAPPPPPPIPHIICTGSAGRQCSHSVQSSNIGSSLGCGHGL